MFDGELLLGDVRLSAVSHNPGLRPGDPAGLPLLLLHAVDHVLLLLLPRHQGVRADDVDLGRRLALHHVHDVVSVGDVEPGQGEEGSFMSIAVFVECVYQISINVSPPTSNFPFGTSLHLVFVVPAYPVLAVFHNCCMQHVTYIGLVVFQ